ncbi:MAG: hypothetical protein MUC66_01695 [Methanolinea sp.]|nr:hypothetical protein [Methanolinea sp.]
MEVYTLDCGEAILTTVDIPILLSTHILKFVGSQKGFHNEKRQDIKDDPDPRL